ncbi:MAG: tRNA-dihydrouridine synthase [bacterium]|nr:tRNA-dihydrouridine synthase [bacterium]
METALPRKQTRLDPRLPWLGGVRRLLSPMAGVTDRAFREICRRYGADMGFCEFASAMARTPGSWSTPTARRGSSACRSSAPIPSTWRRQRGCCPLAGSTCSTSTSVARSRRSCRSAGAVRCWPTCRCSSASSGP